MIFRLLLLMIGVPLVELVLLLEVADHIGILLTVGMVVFTGVAGAMLARAEGLRAWSRFRAAVAEGRMPSEEIQHGLMIAFAAALLLTPGLLTDAVGLGLLVRPVREAVRRGLARRYGPRVRMQTHLHNHVTYASGRSASRTVDAERVSPVEDGDS